jgi:hypothetical protein
MRLLYRVVDACISAESFALLLGPVALAEDRASPG